MTAVFGKLQSNTLELKNGLNILQAPNETGKSTWCAFLLSMLYGINSRERERAGFIPDKIRYAPWSGAAMSGRIDCSAEGQPITIIRTTRRQTAPMGDLQVIYTGTGDIVPGFTGAECGERLTGVSREVFERSAFIRQNGLPITQDSELERRIASLITSGEEETSYSEAADVLKKQLNRRRHNKSGSIPAAEAELQEIRAQLTELDTLETRLQETRLQVETLTAQERLLAAELEQHDLWDTAIQQEKLRQAEQEVAQANLRAELLQQQLNENHTPENDTISRLRGAIVNLETTRKTLEKARSERDEAAKALLKAEAAFNESPFAGQTPEQARREAAAPSVSTFSLSSALLAVLAGFAVSAVIVAALYFFLQSPPDLFFKLLPLAFLGPIISTLLNRRSQKKAYTEALTKRFGTADQNEIDELATAYCNLYEAREAAQAAATQKSAAANTLYNVYSSNEQAILLEVRRFAPTAFEIHAADELLRQCAQQRKALADALSTAQKSQMQRDLLAERMPDSVPASVLPATPPTRPREEVTAKLNTVRAELTAARSTMDQLSGQLQAAGDPVLLRSAAQQLTDTLQQLEEEYSAIRIAMDALDVANTTLQTRFSPELGKRAAKIFSELTGQRYNSVVLDRAFHLSAEPEGDPTYRDIALLSAGTADQLYLATRLAVCTLVLPAEQAVPIILDDALANFDDKRCETALLWLKQEAKNRQILLFTCHSREARFFADDPEVSVQQLTETPVQV